MRGRKHLLAIAAAAWLVGCAGSSDRVTTPTPPALPDPALSTPKPAEPDSCDHTKVRWAVGERASQELLDRAKEAAGARSARFLRPGQIITMEYSASRLNLELDEQEIVHTVRCG